ncbi:MAG: RIP metalloprotease RseP [Oligoflexia bacterium]|nr:RIP metalloprotease RseP [Oligoflexia bacterium]
MNILVPILVIGILIFVHELGHFLVAKWCGVGVLEFAIGFGRKVLKWRRGDTVYSVGIIPLGGYVRMVGDDPARAAEELLSEREADLTERERKLLGDRTKWFAEKPLSRRFAIVFAGPLFNYLFAILLTFVSFASYGKSVLIDEPIIGAVIPGYPAEKAGLQIKDRVISIDGMSPKNWEELSKTVSSSNGKELLLKIQRAAKDDAPAAELEVRVTGTSDTSDLQIIESSPVTKSYKIGIVPDTKRERIGLFEAATLSVTQTWYVATLTFKGLVGMIRGAVSPENIRGPIFIFKEAASSAKQGIERLLDFLTFLSISLAVLNLLPVPVLDGGHLFFFLLEGIRRRPLSMRFQEVANQVGMLLLLALMVFAVGNDLLQLVM